ncbi:MAG: alpha/beta hydrolase [Phenylobacterium sp.]|nr:alpha/beta hydrolase [Phenylobacterium sp.]
MSVAEPQVAVRRFQGDGLQIIADEAGPRNGVPVLLMHGGGQTRQAWGGALAEGARRGYHMLSADLRGHGDSDWDDAGDYRVEAHARDLARIVNQLDQPPVVVGASLGGLTGLYHAGHGGDLRALVLVDIAVKIEPAGAARIGEFMRGAPNGFASLEEAADAVAAYLPHRPRPKNTSGLMRNLRLREDGRLHWHWDPRMMTSDRGPAPDFDLMRAAARQLTIPVLLIRGQLSEVLSPDGVEDFVSLVPHAEFVDIAGADHMVAGDRNDAFNAAVFDFLARHR